MIRFWYNAKTSLVSLTTKSSKEECIECLVCYNHVPINSIIYCFVPVTIKDVLTCELAAFDNYEFNECSTGKISEELMEVDEPQIEEKSDLHAFCRDCVLGQASAAIGEIPIAKGGIGLRCMMTDCDNPILYSEIRNLLPEDVQKKLEERMLEESIGMASLVNLERCTKCNFAIQLEIDKQLNKVFDCIVCNAKFCRFCKRDWDDEHFGVSCEEIEEKDKKAKKDKREREIEKKLNEVVVRKCPRCAIAFIKVDGCNQVTCRCGMTQCYLCRESGIGHDHFCRHLRDKFQKDCYQCNKQCLLFEDANKIDQQMIKEILEKGETSVQTNTNVAVPRISTTTLRTSTYSTPNVAFNTRDFTDLIVPMLFGVFFWYRDILCSFIGIRFIQRYHVQSIDNFWNCTYNFQILHITVYFFF
ncbi:hypothetical protein ACQ4LE_002853, partial [Meloidogyne hapla]